MSIVEKCFPLSATESGEWEKSQKGFAISAKIPVFLLRRYLTRHLDTQRQQIAATGFPPSKFTYEIVVTRHVTMGERGEIAVYTYQAEPGSKEKRPLFYNIHGGGFIAGSVSPDDKTMQLLADRADIITASVDYHLSPEARFPEALNDCQKGLEYLLGNKTLNIDRDRIIISGDSAGGNLAAALVIKLEREGNIKVHKQVLFYPVTDLLHLNSESYLKPELEYKGMHKFILATRDMYLASKADRSQELASPICAKFDRPMPDALILLAERDGLCDDGKNYGKLLERSGTKVRTVIYKGAFHAFINNLGDSQTADDSFEETVAFIKPKE